MNQQKVSFDKLTVIRLFRAVTIFASSESGLQAKLMFAGLIVLLLGINGTNVLNSYVGRDFMTAIEHRNKAQFIEEALPASLRLPQSSRSFHGSPRSVWDCCGANS
jgi:vitamin B12/bleomycin/antimicrobial peptide transport system ATP-binding/permease protein